MRHLRHLRPWFSSSVNNLEEHISQIANKNIFLFSLDTSEWPNYDVQNGGAADWGMKFLSGRRAIWHLKRQQLTPALASISYANWWTASRVPLCYGSARKDWLSEENWMSMLSGCIPFDVLFFVGFAHWTFGQCSAIIQLNTVLHLCEERSNYGK